MLKEFMEPRLTKARLTDDIMQTAMERREYSDAISMETARTVAYHQMANRSVWDDDLRSFAAELAQDADFADADPYTEVQFLAREVEKALIEQDAAEYRKTIPQEEIQRALNGHGREEELSDSDDLITLIADLIVGGKSYVEEEDDCILDALNLTVEDIIAIAEATKK